MNLKQILRLIIASTGLEVIAILSPIILKATGVLPRQQDQTHYAQELAQQMDLPESDQIIIQAWDINQKDEHPLYSDIDAQMIAKVLYNEARGIQSETEKACIVWVILNRFDAGYASTISDVIAAPYQFAYSAGTPVRDDLLSLSYDVLNRWSSEKQGQTNDGRVLPQDYFWYTGDGLHNYFRDSYVGTARWNYSLPSPYTT